MARTIAALSRPGRPHISDRHLLRPTVDGWRTMRTIIVPVERKTWPVCFPPDTEWRERATPVGGSDPTGVAVLMGQPEPDRHLFAPGTQSPRVYCDRASKQRVLRRYGGTLQEVEHQFGHNVGMFYRQSVIRVRYDL
jgi:hypothetical protein